MIGQEDQSSSSGAELFGGGFRDFGVKQDSLTTEAERLSGQVCQCGEHLRE